MLNPEEKYKRKAEKLQEMIAAITGYTDQIQKIHVDVGSLVEAIVVDLRFLAQDVNNFKKNFININELTVAIRSILREAKQV